MTYYNFDIKADDGTYTVGIDTTEGYGYFEHNKLGDERGGGLWFDKVSCENEAGFVLELADYDGVAVLPKRVINILRAQGCVVGEEFE